MSIGSVGSGSSIVPLQPASSTSSVEQTKSFGARIDTALDEFKASQTQARQSAQAWELGMEQDLAAVMVDQQVASLGFQLTLNVRNKALGAYRDIMNMPL